MKSSPFVSFSLESNILQLILNLKRGSIDPGSPFQHEETSRAVLKKVKPHIDRIRDNEYVKRTMIGDLGVKSVERIVLKAKKAQQQDDEYECEVCSENLYISFVSTM